MLKKEFRDVVKQSLCIYVLMIITALIYYFQSQISGNNPAFLLVLKVFYVIFSLFMSFYLGISLFSSEASQRGYEYMLTFPYSRSRLLLNKLIPRLIVLLIIYFGYLVFSLILVRESQILTPVVFNSVYFSIFLVSTSLSPLKENFVANSIATFFLVFVFMAGANLVAHFVLSGYYDVPVEFKLSRLFTADGSDFIEPFFLFLLSLIIAASFIIALFFAFKKFDIRSSGRYLKRFTKYFIPLFIGAMILSFFLVKNSIRSHHYYGYYLTGESDLIQDRYYSNRWYSGDNVKKLPGYAYWNRCYEDSTHLYSIGRLKPGEPWSLLRFNKKSQKIESIYAPGPNEKMNLRGKVYGYKDSVVLTEMPFKKRDGKLRVFFVNKKTFFVKKIEIPLRALSFSGVSESEGIRNWIGYSIRKGGVVVFVINDSGKYKKILWSEKYPLYINNYLITYRNGYMIFGKVPEGVYRETRKIKVEKEFYFQQYIGFGKTDLEGAYIRYIYGKRRYQQDDISFLKIDMESFETKILKFDFAKRGFLKCLEKSDTLFIRFTDKEPKVNGIFRFENDDLTPLKIFKNEKFEIWEDFSILHNGFMIRNGQKKIFFKYPEMKKLTFRGL